MRTVLFSQRLGSSGFHLMFFALGGMVLASSSVCAQQLREMPALPQAPSVLSLAAPVTTPGNAPQSSTAPITLASTQQGFPGGEQGQPLPMQPQPGGVPPGGTPLLTGDGGGQPPLVTGLSIDDLEKLRKAPLVVPLGEKFYLGPDPKVGRIKDVYTDRVGLITEPRLDRNGHVVWAIAQKLGLVAVTLQGKDLAIRVYYVQIVPNVVLLQELLRRQFPDANLRLASAGDRALYVEGTVDSPEQVVPIREFLLQAVPSGGRLINGIRVIGVMQVQLEVCIARVSRTALRTLGYNFLQSDQNGFVGNTTGGLVGTPTINGRGDTAPAGGGAVFRNMFQSSGDALTSTVLRPQSNLFFGFTQQRSSFFNFLELLEQDGLAKILATPTLVTLNGRPADFLVGGEIPLPIIGVASGVTIPDIKYKPFGTRLTFVPVILGEGKIRIEVIPEVSRPTGDTVIVGGTQLPRFETQRIRTTVELESGQTLAMGGLLQVEEEALLQKVPCLGDIPYLGTLFRRIRHEKRETELLVLVTPRLMDPLKHCQRPAILPGQETRTPTDAELYLHGQMEVPRPTPPLPPTVPMGSTGYTPLQVTPLHPEMYLPTPRVPAGSYPGAAPSASPEALRTPRPTPAPGGGG